MLTPTAELIQPPLDDTPDHTDVTDYVECSEELPQTCPASQLMLQAQSPVHAGILPGRHLGSGILEEIDYGVITPIFVI